MFLPGKGNQVARRPCGTKVERGWGKEGEGMEGQVTEA